MENEMKNIGEKYNNDKITHHRYDLIYPTFLENKRKEKLTILEIGLGDNENGTGNSNYFWKEYFPNSILYIMDKDYEYNDGLAMVLKGDQSNNQDLENITQKIKECDLIIDDGSHQPEHQIKTFIYFFTNLLKKGGTYIIEDIECNYWNPKSSVYGYEVGYFSAIDFFKIRIDEVNSEFSKKRNGLKISQITFSKNCIIIKKQTQEEENLNSREYRFKGML